MFNEGKYVIELLKSVLNNEQPKELPSNLDFEQVYHIAEKHSVANMLYYAIEKLQKKPNSLLLKKWKETYNKSVLREACQEIEKECIIKTFSDNNIKCMPLKGSILKHLYPTPDMRMMSDVDILFDSTRSKDIGNIMTKLGYESQGKGEIHDVFFKKPIMNIELHKNLVSDNYEYSNYFNKVWERAKPSKENKMLYEFTIEDCYIYILEHLRKHYENAGSGIRGIMDIWIFLKKYNEKMNWSYINKELKIVKLYDFSKKIEDLSRCWFESELNDKYKDITLFILSNGTYGNIDNITINMLSNEVAENIKIAKFKYISKRLFPSKNHMVIIFPILNKIPILIPFFWIARWIRTLLFHRRIIYNELHIVNNAKKEDLKLIKKIHKKSGL